VPVLLDDVQALLCFARVVEFGSFTKAAAALGVSKSVVSSKTSALEARLGQQLLLRTTRRVNTTAAGLRVYGHARRALESAMLATTGASDTARGVLRVSAPVSLGQLHLARPIASLLQECPGVRVELLLNDRLVDLVEERIDLALRITKLKDSNLIARRLAWVPLQVCASPAYLARHGRPSVPQDLVRHDCLRYSLLRAEQEWRFYGPKGRLPLEVGGSFEANNGTMLREAAIAGMGLAILPRFMIADALERGELEVVLQDFAPRPLGLYAVRSGKRAAPPLLKSLLDALVSAFRAGDWAVASA
jgi:DNA-binding transcriptional LysR family regulator